MKYYKNPIPRNKKELINPCNDCTVGFQSKTTGIDELGEYVELIDCKYICELRKQHLNDYSNNIYNKFVDEKQMRKIKKSNIEDYVELDTNSPSPEEFDDNWFPKCHICGVQVRDIDGEICDNCLSKVNKRLYEENEKLNEDEYK